MLCKYNAVNISTAKKIIPRMKCPEAMQIEAINSSMNNPTPIPVCLSVLINACFLVIVTASFLPVGASS